MCGPAGSGKSTLARPLEIAGRIRLSIDEEAWNRGHRHQPLSVGIRRTIENELRDLLISQVNSGIDVVLDYSFWSRAMRDEYRQLLAPFGVTSEMIYLATPRNVVLDRIRASRVPCARARETGRDWSSACSTWHRSQQCFPPGPRTPRIQRLRCADSSQIRGPVRHRARGRSD